MGFRWIGGMRSWWIQCLNFLAYVPHCLPLAHDDNCFRVSDPDRACGRQCRSNDDCGDGVARCLCDSSCGWSCVHADSPDLCRIPSAPASGAVKLSNFGYFESVASFSCDEGYSLYGPVEKVCQGDGWFWPLDDPFCISDVVCPNPPPAIDNTHQLHSSQPPPFTPGSTFLYRCNRGYRIGGGGQQTEFTMLCTAHGNWVGGTNQMCIESGCRLPTTTTTTNDRPLRIYPEYGENLVPVGARVQAECSAGFRSIDSTPIKVLSCTNGGAWDGDFPTCKELSACWAPRPPENARYVLGVEAGDRIEHGSIYEVYCDGTKQTFIVRCIDGQIDHNFSSCVVDQQPEESTTTVSTESVGICLVESVRGAVFQSRGPGDLLKAGASLEYVCDDRTQNASQSFCSISGKFVPSPECGKGCDSPPPLSLKSWPVYLSTQHGAIAKYKCFAGYRLQNKSIDRVRCLNGIWSRPVPICVSERCAVSWKWLEKHLIAWNGNTLLTKKNAFKHAFSPGNQIRFECEFGYRLVGPEVLECTNGQWLPRTTPKCYKSSFPFGDERFIIPIES